MSESEIIKKDIIRILEESLYIDYDEDSVEENLSVIGDLNRLYNIKGAILTTERFFNGDLNEH